MGFIFHPLAKEEFGISADWYKEQSPKLEGKYIKSIFKIIEFILNNPKSYQIIKGEKRAVKVKGFPFSVIYIVDSEGVFILSVFHHSRNPKVWEQR